VSDTNDSLGKPERARNLKDAIRRVRTAEAERSDVVVELRDAERARLEILADELKAIIADVPPEDEQFVFSVAGGTPPRLWIDMTSFVVMGRDRRTYRFVKDTRLGRTVILESPDVAAMADCITQYVAERIIEREKAIEGDWVIRRAKRVPADTAEVRQVPGKVLPAAAAASRMPDRQTLGWVVAAFLAGVLIGVLVLFGYAWIAVG
jgi:hypothetical protein